MSFEIPTPDRSELRDLLVDGLRRFLADEILAVFSSSAAERLLERAYKSGFAAGYHRAKAHYGRRCEACMDDLGSTKHA